MGLLHKCRPFRFKMVLACVAMLLVAARDAHAYIDPGSGALILQLLLAAFFGAIFFVRRIKLWIRARVNWIWAIVRGKNGG